MNSKYLNDLIRDLWLSKVRSEKLIYSLSQFGIVDKRNVNIHRGEYFLKFYSNYENMIYCNDVTGLVELLTNDYNPKDWFLFLDTSESSLKGCLCHSSKDPKYPEIPILFQTIFDDYNFDIALCFYRLNYNQHNWYIFGDLKSITFITGLKRPSDELCYVCAFDKKDSRIEFGQKYAHNYYNNYPNGYLQYNGDYLVNFKRIMLHPGIIKIDLMKQFIKRLVEKNQSAFHYLVNLFNNLSPDNIKKTEFFDITHLYRLNDNSQPFERHLSRNERAAWQSLRNVSNNLFENYQNQEFHHKHIKELFYNFNEIGCTMSSSLHFLDQHLHIYSQFDFNFTNLQCDRFHKVINFIKKTNGPNWNREIICDYIWCTIKESNDYQSYQRNPNLLPRKFFQLNLS